MNRRITAKINDRQERMALASFVGYGRGEVASLLRASPEDRVVDTLTTQRNTVGWIRIEELSYTADGQESLSHTRVVSKSDEEDMPERGVVIVPIIEAVVAGQFVPLMVLVDVQRPAAGIRSIEPPAGSASKSGEGIEDAARKELREETGLSAGRLTRIGEVNDSTTRLFAVNQIFVAEGLTVGQHNRESEERGMRTLVATLPEVAAMLNGNVIKEPVSQAALYRYFAHSGNFHLLS